MIEYPMHPREKQMLAWIAQNTIKTEDACLDYKLKFGKYAGMTLEEMLGDNTRIAYIQWLKTNTKSDNLKKIISAASKAINAEAVNRCRHLECQRYFLPQLDVIFLVWVNPVVINVSIN